MTEVTEPGQAPEMESAGIAAILADDQSAPAEVKAPAPEPAKQEAAPEAKPETKPEDEPKGPQWFRETLKEKEKRIRDAERQSRQLQEQLERLQGQPTRQPVNYNDPQALYQSFEQRLAEAEQKQSIALSARFAQREHGAELFEETSIWLSERPDIELWAQAQPDPWNAAISRFKQERLVSEIGDDPNAYRERLRQELLAELQQQQGTAPAMTAQRPTIPTPASGQRSAAPRGAPAFAGPTPLGAILKG